MASKPVITHQGSMNAAPSITNLVGSLASQKPRRVVSKVDLTKVVDMRVDSAMVDDNHLGDIDYEEEDSLPRLPYRWGWYKKINNTIYALAYAKPRRGNQGALRGGLTLLDGIAPLLDKIFDANADEPAKMQQLQKLLIDQAGLLEGSAKTMRVLADVIRIQSASRTPGVYVDDDQ